MMWLRGQATKGRLVTQRGSRALASLPLTYLKVDNCDSQSGKKKKKRKKATKSDGFLKCSDIRATSSLLFALEK